MSEKPISPLRQRLRGDMNMRRFVPDTQREHICAAKKLASFLGRSPDSATPEELRALQLHLTETGLQPHRQTDLVGRFGAKHGSRHDATFKLNLVERSGSPASWRRPRWRGTPR
jgi:hypothetical protein